MFLLLSVIAVTASRAAPGILQKQLLPGTTRCIDNTPAGYYFGAGAVDSTVWVINLQGGGACQEESDCIRRSQKALGSSKYWAPTDSGSHSPFLLSDPAANPDFHDAHRVHVAYCSGDGHVGNQSKADASTWGFWFVGKANLLAIVNDLKARHGMDRATHVLLTGESAGAVAQAAPFTMPTLSRNGWGRQSRQRLFRFLDGFSRPRQVISPGPRTPARLHSARRALTPASSQVVSAAGIMPLLRLPWLKGRSASTQKLAIFGVARKRTRLIHLSATRWTPSFHISKHLSLWWKSNLIATHSLTK
eukprot:COSAG02_NODE_14582_length_1257_cov_1.983592_1_plen_303_part_01